MGSALSALQTMAEALDAVNVGLCAFDDEDRAVIWNRTFLVLFPEHAGQVSIGEPYRENLRRFYAARLSAEERPLIDRYIDEGLKRHRLEDRPYSFAHGGRMVTVVARTVPTLGRVRMWRAAEGEVEPRRGHVSRSSLPTQQTLEFFDNVAEGLLVTGVDGAIAWANEAFVKMYGWEAPEQASVQTFDEVYRIAWCGVRDDEIQHFVNSSERLAERLRFDGAAFDLPLPGNRWTRVTQRRRPNGSAYSIHVDISVSKRHEIELLQAQQRMRATEDALRAKSAVLEATLQNMDQGLMLINAEGVVEVCNLRARTLLGLPEALMSKRPRFVDVVAYQTERGEFKGSSVELLDVIRNGESLDRPYTYERERADGGVVEVKNIPITGGGNLRTYSDITERRRNEARMRHVASHDSLTELMNRETFRHRLDDALGSPTRRSAGMAVHFIDLDRFKPVNDTLGHASGDRALAEVAGRLRAVARDGDVLARLGGDEFAILQFQVLDEGQAESLARRVCSALEADMVLDGHRIRIGASVGVALYPQGGQDAETLLRHADDAMYAAKQGRRGVQVFHSG